jgi:hypothetical protein
MKLKDEFEKGLKKSWKDGGNDNAVPVSNFDVISMRDQTTKKLSDKEREEKGLQYVTHPTNCPTSETHSNRSLV